MVVRKIVSRTRGEKCQCQEIEESISLYFFDTAITKRPVVAHPSLWRLSLGSGARGAEKCQRICGVLAPIDTTDTDTSHLVFDSYEKSHSVTII
jgi:hypothetical protein